METSAKQLHLPSKLAVQSESFAEGTILFVNRGMRIYKWSMGMPNDPFKSEEYKEIQREHLYKTILFLLERGIEFGAAAELKYVQFDPELPEEIRERLRDISLFVLSGYTYESAELEEDFLRFEAGFGEENFGSWVTIPLLALKQIFVDDYPIAINIAEAEPLNALPDPSHSMEALLKNPENLKLLKKKKK